jgi:hypothetical protein
MLGASVVSPLRDLGQLLGRILDSSPAPCPRRATNNLAVGRNYIGVDHAGAP